MAQKKKTKASQKFKPKFSFWTLAAFGLVFVGAGLYLVFSSFASVHVAPNPHTSIPSANKTYTISPSSTKLIQFASTFDGAKDNVEMQVAYRKVGAKQWTSFGTTPIDKGPEGKPTVSNGLTAMPYVDASGLSCAMGWGSTKKPADCHTKYTSSNPKISGLPGLAYTNIYFPSVRLSAGKYEWETRAYDSWSHVYSGWSKVSKFTIKTANNIPPEPPTDAPIF